MLNSKLVVTTLACVGGLIWIVCGIVLAQSPAGNPPHSFRNTVHVMPYMALGMLFIGVATGINFLKVSSRRSHLYIGSLITIYSSILYVIGRLIRDLFLNKIGWEPLMPLGFLGVITGFLYMAISSSKVSSIPKSVTALLLITSMSLLTFNDQYTPYMGILFGMFVMLLNLLAFKKFFIREPKLKRS